MGLDSFTYKINYINENISKAFRLDLENQGQTFISQTLHSVNTPDYVKSCLLVDLLYPCIRHHLWINHAFFVENLHQHIMERYRIERGYSLNLIQNFTNYLNKILPPPDFEELKHGNESFITYIFVMTMSSALGGDMLEEIGLGSSIFKKISQAIKSFALVKHQADEVSLALSDDDIVFHQVIEKISQERVKIAWYLDAARIRYMMVKAPTPFGELFWKNGVHTLESLLLGIGQGLITNFGAAIDFIKTVFLEEFSLSLSDMQAKLLLQYLEARGLLFFSCYSPSKSQISVVPDQLLLTDLACELTAIHFVNICGEDKVIPEYLLSLNPSWQTAVLCKHKNLFADYSITKQLIALPLAPSSIELLFSFIPSGIIEEDHGFFTELLGNAYSSARKTAFCRAIGQIENPDLVVKLLAPVVKNDKSPEVRSAALVQLQNLKAPPKKLVEEFKMQNARRDLGAYAAIE